MGSVVAMDAVLKDYFASRNPALRDELILEYAPLVKLVVGRLGLAPTGIIEQDDLVDSGIIGLINAIDRYDPSSAPDFEAFASAYIHGAVIEQLHALGWNQHTSAIRMRQIEGALAQLEPRLGRSAKEEEIAEELNVSVDRYRSMLKETSPLLISLDTPLRPLQ